MVEQATFSQQQLQRLGLGVVDSLLPEERDANSGVAVLPAGDAAVACAAAAATLCRSSLGKVEALLLLSSLPWKPSCRNQETAAAAAAVVPEKEQQQSGGDAASNGNYVLCVAGAAARELLSSETSLV